MTKYEALEKIIEAWVKANPITLIDVIKATEGNYAMVYQPYTNTISFMDKITEKVFLWDIEHNIEHQSSETLLAIANLIK